MCVAEKCRDNKDKKNHEHDNNNCNVIAHKTSVKDYIGFEVIGER